MNMLTLHLLPEFGWTLQNKPVFGPGSVFQGHAQLTLHEPLALDRVRLVFQAKEEGAMLHYKQGGDDAHPTSLFAVQQTLWESKDGCKHLEAGTHAFAFTVQMPMVQFPPSMDHALYQCQFKLVAVAEKLRDACDDARTRYKSLLLREEELVYMPFVATSVNKQPFHATQEQGELKVTTALPSLDVLLGNALEGTVHVSLPAASSTKAKSLHFTATLHQCVLPTLTAATHANLEANPTAMRAVAQLAFKMDPEAPRKNDDASQPTYHSAFRLPIPEDLPPTFTYGQLVTVTYRLVLVVKRKGPLGMWANAWTREFPVTLGTLGIGLHAPPDLQVYTTLMADDDETMLQRRPKFMKAVEYEDALPLYEPAKLPEYHSVAAATDAPCATLPLPVV
ncbi:hypothetical protein BC940DRAFT_308027 [Gongronella butleri]|nr:hypothetical protein BC940DRAFT_308027 [Gongronella butleri]